MRIGIDARPTQGKFTGDATYWRGLVSGLSRLDTEDEITLYLDPRLQDPGLHLSAHMSEKALAALNWRMWSLWSFPRELKRDRIDVAHVQYTIPPFMPCPVITSIHDVSFKRHPEFFSAKDRLILDAGVKRAAKQAARILAISEYTKKEILELYPMVSPGLVEVVYAGVDEQFTPLDKEESRRAVKEKYKVDSPFILTVGVIQPRKNLPRLLEGLAELKSQGALADRKLVVAGKYGWKESALPQKIEDLGLTEDVVFPGYIPYEDLPMLYSAAEVFVYPSVYEGFGLPPIEAMACGAPAITGNLTSLPEVVGEAGIMVDPYDPSAFADAIAKVISSESLQKDMSTRGLEQAKKFSWTRMAEQVLGIYYSVDGGNR